MRTQIEREKAREFFVLERLRVNCDEIVLKMFILNKRTTLIIDNSTNHITKIH